MNSKTSTIIIIDCQTFQHCPSQVLTANFYHSAFLPNPNTCKASKNISVMNQVNDIR